MSLHVWSLSQLDLNSNPIQSKIRYQTWDYFYLMSYITKVQSRDRDGNNNIRIVNYITEDDFVYNSKDGETMPYSLSFLLY